MHRGTYFHETRLAKCMTWAVQHWTAFKSPQQMWTNKETGWFKGKIFYFVVIKHPQVLQLRGGQNRENLDRTVSGTLATSLIYGLSRYYRALAGAFCKCIFCCNLSQHLHPTVLLSFGGLQEQSLIKQIFLLQRAHRLPKTETPEGTLYSEVLQSA